MTLSHSRKLPTTLLAGCALVTIVWTSSCRKRTFNQSAPQVSYVHLKVSGTVQERCIERVYLQLNLVRHIEEAAREWCRDSNTKAGRDPYDPTCWVPDEQGGPHVAMNVVSLRDQAGDDESQMKAVVSVLIGANIPSDSQRHLIDNPAIISREQLAHTVSEFIADDVAWKNVWNECQPSEPKNESK